jgi:hypothetical protein
MANAKGVMATLRIVPSFEIDDPTLIAQESAGELRSLSLDYRALQSLSSTTVCGGTSGDGRGRSVQENFTMCSAPAVGATNAADVVGGTMTGLSADLRLNEVARFDVGLVESSFWGSAPPSTRGSLTGSIMIRRPRRHQALECRLTLSTREQHRTTP